MQKLYVKLTTIALALLITLCMFLLPIYKIDQNYIDEHFKTQIEDITKEEPDAFFEHTFTKQSFDNIVTSSDGKYFATLGDFAWEVKFTNKDYIQTNDGLYVKGGFRLVQREFPDFVKMAVFASGKGTISLKIDDILIKSYPLTENIERYDFEHSANEYSKVEIIFSDLTTIKRIKINEFDHFNLEDAKFQFLRRLIMHSGLITTNQKLVGIDSVLMYEDYINEETLSLIEGVPFLSLFRMLIEDILYNFSLFSQTAGMPLSSRISTYFENNHQAIISTISFIGALFILGVIVYVAVSFVVGLILKKDSAYMIPSLIMLLGFVMLLNITTFVGSSYFDGTHNIATEYRLMFFESSNITFNYVAGSILAILLVLVNLSSYIVDFIKNKKNKNSKKQFITYTVISSVLIVFTVLGLIVK